MTMGSHRKSSFQTLMLVRILVVVDHILYPWQCICWRHNPQLALVGKLPHLKFNKELD